MKLISRALGVLAALAFALAPALVSGQAAQFTANATGANEVPAVTTTATGTLTGSLDEAAGTFTWTLSVPAITAATAAHLHSGAAGTNGPVVIPLFAAPTGSPASSISANGTARAADLAGPLAGNFAGFAAALKAGTIYLNVHTSTNPGGEIRGQVTAAAGATPAPAKTGNAGLMGGGSNGATLAVVTGLLAVLVVVGGRACAVRRRR